jgi:tetratricopeptide (TPR) repeat protein
MAFDKRKAIQNALSYTQQGKWDRAISEYLAILKADPHDLTVCNNLGDLYARAGKAPEAIEQYLKLGELYRTDGLSVKAIAVYKKIIKLDPGRTEALLACADLYEEQGLTGEAKIQLVTAAEHYAKAGETPKVIEIYQRLAALDQANSMLLTKLADLLRKEGRREEAAAQYELAAQAAEAAGQAAESKRLLAKMRELAPESPQAHLALGEQLLREGRHAEAVDALLKATASDRTNAQAWCQLGEAYVGLGQALEAIAALEQAVALGLPEDAVRRPLAKALILEGRTDEGLTLCQKLTEDALARDNPDEAIAFCHEIVAQAPNPAPIHAHLVKLLQDLGRDEEARAATWALAAAYEACGETLEAVHVYHQLLERDPSDAEAKARLEVLEGPPAPSVEEEALAVPEPEAAPGLEAESLVLEEAAPLEVELTPTEIAATEPVPTELAPTELPPTESVPTPLAPEEPPALELPPDDALTLGDATGLGPEARPTQVFDLDESGELAGIRYLSQEPQGIALEGLAGFGGLGIELPGESPGEGISALEALGEEEEASGEVAELLAEAEVYLKYGLTEKARERLVEAVRLVPQNLTAHRQLRVLYLERPQVEEACGEILAIARILRERGQLGAAQRELQEGLRFAPGSTALQGMLAEVAGASRSVEAAPAKPPAEPRFEFREDLAAQAEQPQDIEVVSVPAGDEGPAEPAPPEMAPSEVAPVIELPDLGGDAAALEEEIPVELRSLLEEAGEEPGLVLEAPEPDADQAMADDLAEADFYLSQGMVEEARAVHRRMRARDANHPAVVQLDGRLEPSAPVEAPEAEETAPLAGVVEEAAPQAQAELPPDVMDFLPETLPETVPPPEPRVAAAPAPATPQAPREAARTIPERVAPPPPPRTPPTQPPIPDIGAPRFSVMQGGGEAGADGFVNLGAELEKELAAEDRGAPADSGAPLVEDLIREFQKGVREHLDEKDFETHYNLGIAYKEMELYDEAIQEFRLAARDPGRALPCADLLGLCFLAKGDLDAAIQELRAGLEVRGHPRESYYALRYDLGVAYEAHGDLQRALECFEALQADDERFRDASARAKDLRERLRRSQVASLVTSPAPTEEPPKRAKSKKKISFI